MGKGGQNVLGSKNQNQLKPSRSDEILDAEEQTQIAEQIRSHFEALAPKRHRKPNRSESNEGNNVQDDLAGDDIPELNKLQQLNSLNDHLVFNGSGVDEEFVETDYYKDLNAVGKQHHVTGSGYIRLENEVGSYFRLRDDGHGRVDRIPVRCNPACNDWVPSETDYSQYVSNKPVRSG